MIVHLRPTPAAKELAARSREAGPVPEGFSGPGAATYYNLEDESIGAELRATVAEQVGRVVDEIGPYGMTVTQRFSYQFGFAARVTPAALGRILAAPDVIAVEKDAILREHLKQGIPLMNAAAARSAYQGAGVSIAICDTGIDTRHPRLGGTGLDSDPIFNAKVIGGYDIGDNDDDPRPGSMRATPTAPRAPGSRPAAWERQAITSAASPRTPSSTPSRSRTAPAAMPALRR